MQGDSNQMATPRADIGLIGLAVMGQNLVLNMNDRGYTVAVFNRTVSKVDDFIANEAAGTNVILFWLSGGPGHMETWDPKPSAPEEVRGPFQPIPTNAPGMEISEIFPKMARHADKFSLASARIAFARP